MKSNALLLFCAVASLAACQGKIAKPPAMVTPPPQMMVNPPPPDMNPPPPDMNPPPSNFDSVAVPAYVGKVKTLLTGQAATDAEVAAVEQDPNALKGLIAQWITQPSYQDKMLAFFSTAFQQNQSAQSDFTDQEQNTALFGGNNGTNQKLMLANHHEMFARTALQLIAEGRPFTETYTTKRFMMTPALAGMFAMLDSQYYDDAQKFTDQNQVNYPALQLTFQKAGGQVPLSEARDPSSPNFMHFYTSSVPLATAYPVCNTDPVTFTVTNKGLYHQTVFAMLLGGQFPPASAQNTGVAPVNDAGVMCPPVDTSAFTYNDFSHWRMVTIRQPLTPELSTPYFDIDTIRFADELVLSTPRVGFFTTPSFLASWGTNKSNQARVTINQTLIVALNQQFDGTDGTMPLSLAAVDQTHTSSSAMCFACHQQLDPMRQFFRHDMTFYFHPQKDPVETTLSPQFAWDGVAQQGQTLDDLGALLAKQPRFATAWEQKLCQWANSAPCDESDPEFQRVAQAFAQSNFSWPALVEELFASPLVTYAKETQSADVVGQSFGIARQAHFCSLVSARLGITDACGLSPATAVPTTLRPLQTIMNAYPSDSYTRGQVGAVLSNDPTLFSRTGLENSCIAIANQVVDVKGSKYSSAQPYVAIADFAHNLMGLTGERSAGAVNILTNHYDTALTQTNIKPTDALRSTFTLACLSPYVVGIGQ